MKGEEKKGANWKEGGEILVRHPMIFTAWIHQVWTSEIGIVLKQSKAKRLVVKEQLVKICFLCFKNRQDLKASGNDSKRDALNSSW